jgi:L-iditol 2-dehydrogenase
MSVPTHCRAAVLVKHGAPMEIRDVPVPQTLEPGAVLVRTRAATICATDVHLAEGEVGSKQAAAALPSIVGHEMVGEVVRTNGDERDSIGQPLAEGDRVIWTPGYCGQCVECVLEHNPTLCLNRRGYMTGDPADYPHLIGAFAEYGYIYPTSGRIKVPDVLPDPVAAAASCALRTTVHAFDRLGMLDSRHTVVVQGAGPLGLFAVVMAVVGGARQVIVVGAPAERLALARKWGAVETIDLDEVPDPADRLDRIMQLTEGRGAEVVVEMSGAPVAFTEGLDMLRRGGRYVVVGQVGATTVPVNPAQVVMKHATVIGCFSGAIEHYARALQFMETHRDRFDWSEMITSVRPLDDINAALDAMRSHQEIKPAIVMA